MRILIGTPAFVCAVFLGLVAWLSNFGHEMMSYEQFAFIRTMLAVAAFGLALLTAQHFNSDVVFKGGSGTELADFTKTMLVFWGLFPPLWFVMEYCAMLPRHGAGPFIHDASADKIQHLRAFADCAWKIWAGFLAIFWFVLNRRVSLRKEKELKAVTAALSLEEDEDAPHAFSNNDLTLNLPPLSRMVDEAVAA